MKNKGIEKAIIISGSQRALAKRCGRAQSTISDWLHCNKSISPQYVPLLVKATGGEVKGFEFRPDLPDLFPKP